MALRDKAIDLMRSGDFGTALPIFERLISMDCDDAGLQYMAGQCARFNGDLAKAVSFHQRAVSLDPSEPQNHLALGIALQLSGRSSESIESLRNALTLDGDLATAYNSLAITQKGMGEYDLARHNFDEGLKAVSRSIGRTLRNERTAHQVPLPSARGTHWIQVAIGAAMFVCASDSRVTRLAWPDGEEATKEIAKGSHGGLFWVDREETGGSITRVFLPNFFNTVHSLLRRDTLYANLLGNLGSVLDLLGEHSEAEACIAEAEEFLSGRGAV
jgi:tetratricopeptide (TPR) repeat protein